MENTPQQQPQPTAQHRWRGIVIAVLVIALLAIAALALRSFWSTEQAPVAERPLDLPVEETDVNSMGELAQIMEGKPLPNELPGMILPPFDEDDHVRGERFAEFSIVEYSNFGNKLAALLHPELKAYVEASNGSVNWVARHFPITQGQYLPAQAAECAYFQGANHNAFWAYRDASFMMPNATVDVMVNLAVTQGLDGTAFRTCLENDFTRDKVLIDIQDGALDAKVEVSPSYVVVNNLTGEMRLVEGVNTLAYLQQVIDLVR